MHPPHDRQRGKGDAPSRDPHVQGRQAAAQGRPALAGFRGQDQRHLRLGDGNRLRQSRAVLLGGVRNARWTLDRWTGCSAAFEPQPRLVRVRRRQRLPAGARQTVDLGIEPPRVSPVLTHNASQAELKGLRQSRLMVQACGDKPYVIVSRQSISSVLCQSRWSIQTCGGQAI